jgi:glutamate N-acetyltransferase/amino-acid N-acetyltransferase
VPAAEVAVCSTGLIGERLPMQRLLPGVDAAVAAATADGGPAAAEAIMTTDTIAKTCQLAGPGYLIGGMAKGAAMLAPALATMLAVVCTDASLTAAELDLALRDATRTTFDRLDSDGCMSTNDTVLLLASGASGVRPEPGEFTALLASACADLAGQMQQDAEGATKSIAIEVIGAATDAVFEPDELSVAINGVWVCRGGYAAQDRSAVDLTGRAVTITVELSAGSHTATVLTTDLTAEYVRENSEYST